MKTLPQPGNTAARAAELWPPESVLAMNTCLLAHPELDVQRWFEEQVALHLGYTPHGRRVASSPIA
jgi:hypothetical protein